jgi:putative transposase
MKLIAQVKLLPTKEQVDALKDTIIQANLACQFVSDAAWEAKIFRQYDLHHLCYKNVREKFNISAQIVVRVISKVADAYKVSKRKVTFKTTGAIGYDDRILSWRLQDKTVSIWTTAGRQRIPFVCGDRQWELLQTRQGESDLIFFKGMFFIATVCDVEEPKQIDVEGVLGVDLGIVNIAVDSDGEVHSAKGVNNIRYRRQSLRSKLQKKGTRSAKRKLKKMSGKESRYARDLNHKISKHLVVKAKDTNRAIAMEDLNGISERVTVRRSQRATLHNWSFYQLRIFVTYKALRLGVPFSVVDPRNTSRTCPACGHIDKANRKSQSRFLCVVCGFAGLADHIAAINIGRRADVNQPIVARGKVDPVQSVGLSVATNQIL